MIAKQSFVGLCLRAITFTNALYSLAWLHLFQFISLRSCPVDSVFCLFVFVAVTIVLFCFPVQLIQKDMRELWKKWKKFPSSCSGKILFPGEQAFVMERILSIFDNVYSCPFPAKAMRGFSVYLLGGKCGPPQRTKSTYIVANLHVRPSAIHHNYQVRVLTSLWLQQLLTGKPISALLLDVLSFKILGQWFSDEFKKSH